MCVFVCRCIYIILYGGVGLKTAFPWLILLCSSFLIPLMIVWGLFQKIIELAFYNWVADTVYLFSNICISCFTHTFSNYLKKIMSVNTTYLYVFFFLHSALLHVMMVFSLQNIPLYLVCSVKTRKFILHKPQRNTFHLLICWMLWSLHACHFTCVMNLLFLQMRLQLGEKRQSLVALVQASRCLIL